MGKVMLNRKYFISKMWSSDVKKRDSKKCILCGSKKELEAHHIFGISQYPYLITEINNGITLCKECHAQYHEEYDQINPVTWTEFLLKHQNTIKNIEISYSNSNSDIILPNKRKQGQSLSDDGFKASIS